MKAWIANGVTGLYILSVVCLVLAAGAWREKAADFVTELYLVLFAAGIVVTSIRWGCRRTARRDKPKAPDSAT